MNWQAVPQRLCSGVREMPQSVHRSRGTAGAIGGAHSKAELAGLLGNSGKVTPFGNHRATAPATAPCSSKMAAKSTGRITHFRRRLVPLGSLG